MKNKPLESCCLCSGVTEEKIYLEKFPLTGVYAQKYDPHYPRFDQGLRLCRECGHGQLAFAIDPSEIYSHTYSFRTTESKTASAGVDYFVNYLNTLTSKKRFKRVLEFGCNDGHLLKKLSPDHDFLLGVDPVAEEKMIIAPNVKISRKEIQQVDVEGILEGKPDLIVSQHTMEHLVDPLSCLKNLKNLGHQETLYVFEFPSFDHLLKQNRIDQIFHQHVQYFGLYSFQKCIENLGFKILDFNFHYTYWGALLIAFKHSDTKSSHKDLSTKILPSQVENAKLLFDRQLSLTSQLIENLRTEKIYGYGAALMLPTLAYHLKTDFKFLEFVFDDNLSKDGLSYANLPVTIRHSRDFNFHDSTIFLTAMDNRRVLTKVLYEKKAKMILNPLMLM